MPLVIWMPASAKAAKKDCSLFFSRLLDAIFFTPTWDSIRRMKAACLPEPAQYWASSAQSNLLTSDWPIDAELHDPATGTRVWREIAQTQGHAFIQRNLAEHLAHRIELYRDGTCATRDTVRHAFTKIRERKFFEIYK